MKRFISFLFTAFSLFQLSAQTIELNEVKVEAEAQTNAIEEQKAAVPAKIVISSKDLNNFGHHSVGDVLKRMPRILMQGPPTFNRNIMMGGLDKQFQTVLIDGNRPAGGEDYRDLKLDRIPADMVEEIEIIYNPPAEWGADAAMGVVNIKLKDAPIKRTILANIAADNTSTASGINPDLSLTYGDNFGKTAFIASYSFNHFDRANKNTIYSVDTSGIQNEDIVVDVHAFTGNIQHQFNEHNKLTFKTFFSNYHESLDYSANAKKNSEGDVNFRQDTASDTKLRRLHTQSLRFETKGSNWSLRNELNLAQNFDKKDRWRVAEKSSLFEESLEDEDQKNTESFFRSDFLYSSQNIRYKAGVRGSGLWREYDRLVYTKEHGHRFWESIEDGSYTMQEYRAGAYSTAELTLGRLLIAQSLRYDYDKRSYETANDKGSYQYTSLNPSLHTKYSFEKHFALKADMARQVSRPPFNAQVPIDKVKHKKSTIERGNKELMPSTATNFSIGAEKYFGNNSYVTLRGFASSMRDVVEKKFVGIDETTGYTVIQYINVDSALVWGFDIDTRIKLLDKKSHQLELLANATLFGSEVRDASTGKMRRLNEQPEWITNGSLDYFNADLKLQMSVGVNYVGNRYIAGGTDEGTLTDRQVYQPYMQWDARIKYFFKPWGSIYLNAVNIFDETVDIQQGNVRTSEIAGQNIRIGVNFTL